MVEQYLNQVLRKQLKGFYIPNAEINSACQDIALKMNSLFAYREDALTWNGVLLIGQEEGQFYQPCSVVSPFVVVTIRNSLIETYHSTKAPKKNRPYLLDEDMRSITEAAIRFWDGCDLNSIVPSVDEVDYYQGINGRYPAAWQAVKALGASVDPIVKYPKITTHPDEGILKLLEQHSGNKIQDGSIQAETQDGYSTKLNSALIDTLNAIQCGEMDIFYSKCFKMVSRNYGKLLSIIECVLHFDNAFVTANYYITNGHVERRTKLHPPAHNQSAVREMSNLVAGSRGEHRDALQWVLKSISQ